MTTRRLPAYSGATVPDSHGVPCNRRWGRPIAWLTAALLPSLMLVGCAASESRLADRDPFVARVAGLRDTVALVSTATAYGTAAAIASDRNHTFLLTAAHVVEHDRRVFLRFDDGVRGIARVVRRDAADDAAILEFDRGSLPTLPLADHRRPLLGERIGLAGYPVPDAFEEQHLGIALSVYDGRIASLRRGAFELDVRVVPGESGGPVIRIADGRLIGIATSRFDDERSIGFAVPIERLRRVLAGLPQQ